MPVPHGSIRTLDQLVSYLLQECVYTSCLNGLEGHPVPSGSAIGGSGQPIGFGERFQFADMNEEAPTPPGLLSLRLDVYPPSQVWQTDGRFCQVAPASPVERGINQPTPSPTLRWVFQLLEGVHRVRMTVQGQVHDLIEGLNDVQIKILRLFGNEVCRLYQISTS